MYYLCSVINQQNKKQNKMTTKELFQQLPHEIARVKKMAGTLQGFQNLISIHEKHFNEKYQHGENICYNIARVNILRKADNKQTLC